MAFKKAAVQTFPELKDTVDDLISEYSVALAEVQSNRILYLKSDGKSKRVAKLSSIKVPHPSVTPFRFALTVYERNWDDLDESRQVLHVMRELLRIRDFEEAKMDGYPLQDFPEIVEKYGTLWEEDENLPSPLDKNATKGSQDVNEDTNADL